MTSTQKTNRKIMPTKIFRSSNISFVACLLCLGFKYSSTETSKDQKIMFCYSGYDYEKLVAEHSKFKQNELFVNPLEYDLNRMAVIAKIREIISNK